jgi:hypothetical protein
MSILPEPPKLFKGFITPIADDVGARQYPYNHVTQTESGHFKEMDDSPGNERIRTQHRTGTYVEMQPDGSEVHKIVGNGYEIIAKDKQVLVKGICHITVEGDSVFHVYGDAWSSIEGNAHLDIHGDSKTTIGGDATIMSSGDVDIIAGGLLADINLSASNGVNVTGDLHVSGDITSGSNINAVLNVGAGLKLFSNQGVETLGGLNVGFAGIPVTVPGVITSTVSIVSPTAQHGLINAAQEFVGNITAGVEDVGQEFAGNITAAWEQLVAGIGPW